MEGGTAPFLVRNHTMTDAEISTNISGTRNNVVLQFGSNIIQILSQGVVRKEWNSDSVTCMDGLFYHPDMGVCKTIPSVAVAAVPASALVRAGTPARVKTTIDTDLDLDCTFSGALMIGSINHRPGANRREYTNDSLALNSAQIIQVNCRIPGYTAATDPVFKATKRISVIPNLEDI
jgi:hypothetical protein